MPRRLPRPVPSPFAGPVRWAAPVFAGAALATCSVAPPRGAAGEPPLVRRGADRADVAYDEPHREAKRALFERINADRRAAGLEPVAYSLLAAKVGDAFCADAARNGTMGHWDLAGRAPYQRWGEAGGVDYHAQNFGAVTRVGAAITEPVAELLVDSHARMMAETPPDDGHRRTILDPTWTHVGIGVARVAGEFRMTEEFSRQVLDWVELPAGPLPAGKGAAFGAKLPRGWEVGGVDISFERPPDPLSRAEIARRTSYGYPLAVRVLSPFPGPGLRWASGASGDFGVASNGRFGFTVPLDRGPGNYYVLVYAGLGPISGKRLSAVTGALIQAR